MIITISNDRKLFLGNNAVDENRKPSNRVLKFKKSLITTSRKFNCSVKNLDRLVGGADAFEEREEIPKPAEKTVEQTEAVEIASVKKEDGKSILTVGPCCICMSQVSELTGDKKVDEMIDYVHHNLQEVGKALASLGENFEHDSKLMFADIFGRIQQWIGLVQNKLDICKNEIDALRKELIAQACEINNLRKLLAECRQEREKLDVATQIVETRITEASVEPETRPVIEEARKEEVVMKHIKKPKEPEEKEKKNEGSERVIKEDTERVIKKDTERVIKEDTERVMKKDRVMKEDTERVIKKDTERVIKEDTERITKEPKEIEICTDAAIQSILKDKDSLRREIELEGEIARLRKENERIIKERAEYENAIQRALLRGVSSLNVEALRVLRCPPIPCCTPCAPCPASATEPIVPCKKDGASAGLAKGCVTQRTGNSGRNTVHEQSYYTVKRPCASPCCSAGKSRKPASNSSMLFLLHQRDTENICISNNMLMSQVCGSPVMKKIEIPPCPRFI
ncbi:synaptonemal complex protein ZEP1-like [Frieseomelitta varia]|uniref:synaptonemal complex protein ZEP1-like n=1 Tax=Frieseomelitta varia TaxID=561572 RepID=UPI001CB6850C|nr:synaptonemal complex protein ZEP1-like [Frieseomelitta varia]